MTDRDSDVTDLAMRLGQEAQRQGFTLEMRVAEGGSATTHAYLDRDRGTFHISGTGPFGINLWMAEHIHLAYGAVSDLTVLVAVLGRWQDGRPLRELQAICPELPLTPNAVGYDEGRAVEATWQAMLQRADRIRLGDPEITEAAYAEPRLRALFPWPSHGTLGFLRSTLPPRPPNDLPFITGGNLGFSVYAPGYTLIGETRTAQEAAALAVAHLPEDCGPAIEGYWPGATCK